MYIIGICDDEDVYREQIRDICEKYFEEQAEECLCLEFTSGEELLEYREGMIHLLFLDIEMPGMSGIDVMRRIENSEQIWRIIFVSSHEEMVWDSFGIKTMGFVRKPINLEEIYKCLGIMQRENVGNEMMMLEVGNKITTCRLEEIYYLQAERNYTALYKRTEKLLLNGNMKAWQEKVNASYFVRVHKSFLVNLVHIREVGVDKLVLENGIEIPIGRKYAGEVKEAYFSFIRSRMRG